MMGDQDRLKDVWGVNGRIYDYSEKVRGGFIRGITDKVLKNVLCITSGGVHYGPEAVYEALRADKDASEATKDRGLTLSFVNNVDPVDFDIKIRNLKADETLFIIISKSFDSMVTMYNARMARRWLQKSLSAQELEFSDIEMVGKHFCAITADYDQASQVSDLERHVFMSMHKKHIYKF